MKIINKIQNLLLADNEERKEKTSFWATDCEKPVFDLYHAWIGTPPTNPIEAEKLIMFNSAKMIELSYVQMFDKLGILVKPEGEQHRVDMEREGVKVTGYMDAVLDIDGETLPCELKTMYGDYQEKEIASGVAKTSYLKQLAVYMDFMGKDKGILMYVNRGTGAVYEFLLERTSDLLFRCNAQTFDLSETYKRWARLYNNNITPRLEPKSEYKYKYDIETTDWSKVSKSTISAVRNGHKVLGDWEVSYSPYKNLIIEREGTQLGYNAEEIARIKELTAGYSTK